MVLTTKRVVAALVLAALHSIVHLHALGNYIGMSYADRQARGGLEMFIVVWGLPLGLVETYFYNNFGPPSGHLKWWGSGGNLGIAFALANGAFWACVVVATSVMWRSRSLYSRGGGH